MNKHVFGGLLIAFSMLMFSFIGPFVRYVKLPLFVIMFYTSLFGIIILFSYFLFKKKLKWLLIKKYIPWMIVSGLLVFGNIYTYYKAFKLTTLANSVLTHYTAPIFAALLAPLVLKEKLERVTIVSLLISIAGLFLIASKDLAINNQHLIGIIFGTLSGVFYGILILVNKKLADNFFPTIIIFFQSVIIIAIIAPFLPTFQYTITPFYLFLLIAYTLIIFLLPSFLYLKGLKYVEAQHAGILAYTEPIFVVLIGILIYKEIPSLNILLGGSLIIYSGYLVLKAEAKRK